MLVCCCGITEQKNATPDQIAIVWLLTQKLRTVSLPAPTKLHRLDENIIQLISLASSGT
ncbi:MAG TPA: hypothetical protein V6D12_20930 [Candidatus Obscuribacterales bacterium]